jgi:bla regulator protein blaR1
VTSPAFLEAFLSLTLQATLLIAVAGLLANRLNSRAILDRYWTFCHLVLLALAIADFGLPSPRVIPSLTPSNLDSVQMVLRWESRMALAVLIPWLSGMCVFTCFLLASGLRTGHLLRKAEFARLWPSEEDGLLQLGQTRIALLKNDAVFSPVCWQFHRPYILLPSQVDRFPQPEQLAILRHEVEHLRAGHPLTLFIQRLTEIVFWFHPLVWWTSRQADLHREFRCDAAAVRNPTEAKTYLGSMLLLAETLPPKRILFPVGLGFGDQPSMLRQRIARLTHSLAPATQKARGQRLLLGLLATTALCVMVLRVPINVTANHQAWWSPWPRWTAGWLNVMGVSVRDYELNGHRLRPHHHE